MTFATRFRSIGEALGSRRTMTAVLAGCVLAAAAAGVAAELLPRDTFDHPGRLVSLPDHRRLNFRCMGHGAPAVILESGFGASSIAWGRVQPSIAAVTRVCSYDRAGYGFS
ncbi:MAG: hypothetical protein ACXWKR_15960, partial [Phenylobacterium sp.]